MTIYKTRYLARKVAYGDEVVVKVEGGYTIMSARDYQIWRGQR